MRDIDIRRALLGKMDHLHNGDSDTLIVQELGLCQGTARVDVAVVNGSIHGYEIKSERDTLFRLPGQTDIYSRTLDFVTIVTAPSHADAIRKTVPYWWGIWSAVQQGNEVLLHKLRRSRRNPSIDPFALAQLLWREEALQALTDLGLVTGLRSKPREILWNRLASELTVKELGTIVRQYLKRRGPTWRSPSLLT
jgi:hypothetical protein